MKKRLLSWLLVLVMVVGLLPTGVWAAELDDPTEPVFTEDAENTPLTTLGPALEHHPAFPGGVNVEFVQVIAENRLRMRVWERGSGITMACGTGACASAAAAVKKGFCRAGEPVELILDGGSLYVTVGSDGSVLMSGPAEFVYEGEVS